MTDDKEDRARRLAVYMIENGGTVRSAGKEFHISKSTVRVLLEKNKSERHLRGGMATKRKYEQT